MGRWATIAFVVCASCVGPNLDLGRSDQDEDTPDAAEDSGVARDAASDGTCVEDLDCAAVTGKLRCQTTLQRCVQCLTNADCGGTRCEVGEWHCESHL